MPERDVYGCSVWLYRGRGPGTVINRVEGCLTESILIVSVCHRIYIDCFCSCYLSEAILIVAVFQNQYCLFLSVTEFIFIVSVCASEMWTVAEGDWIVQEDGGRKSDRETIVSARFWMLEFGNIKVAMRKIAVKWNWENQIEKQMPSLFVNARNNAFSFWNQKIKRNMMKKWMDMGRIKKQMPSLFVNARNNAFSLC